MGEDKKAEQRLVEYQTKRWVSYPDLADPDFKNRGRVHEWKNYIPDVYIEGWKFLEINTKIGLYVMAKQAANSEEWD